MPIVTASHLFGLCLSGTADVLLQARLKSIAPTLASTAVSYEGNARSERLDLMPRVSSVGSVTREELLGLYRLHMSAVRGCARGVYDQIKNAAPFKKCPLCGVGTVGALDHHLPQSKYPDLAVVPANLVPACHFCNAQKRARYPQTAGEQTLHPYFDDRLLKSRWLGATVDRGPPVSIRYAPFPPVHWELVDKRRVERHFQVCGLSILFSSNANDELSVLKSRLNAIEAQGGVSVVHSHLMSESVHYYSRQNSWQLSMYEALAADPWFVGGGFRAIA
jgi:hypothetical protein